MTDSKINKLCERMKYWCEEANLGYDQSNRWDIRVGGECDCSTLVYWCMWEAGLLKKPSNYKSKTLYTGTIKKDLTAAGWKVVSNNGNPKKGDVLLASGHHVAVCIDNSKRIANASIDENGKASGGKAGDQTGKETRVRSYYNYPWDCYLRYSGSGSSSNGSNASGGKSIATVAQEVIDGEWGNGDARKSKLEAAGYDYDAVQDKVNELLGKGSSGSSSSTSSKITVDGQWGKNTTKALQKALGTEADGLVSNQRSAYKKHLQSCLAESWKYSSSGCSPMIKALQKKVGADVDGIAGPTTIKKMQKKLGVTVDGYCGPDTVKALQKWINNGCK